MFRAKECDLLYRGHRYEPKFTVELGERLCYEHWVRFPEGDRIIAPFEVRSAVSAPAFRLWVDLECADPEEFGLKRFTNQTMGRIARIREDHGLMSLDALLVWVKLSECLTD